MYKLCGGTLLVLLSNSRKNRISETSLLINMLKIFDPNTHSNDPHLTVTKDKFKQCKTHSALATPFEKKAMQDKMTKDIRESYVELLNRTKDFVKNYIDTDSTTNKDVILIKAILEVIEQDTSISDNQEFYILSNGKSITKKELVSIEKVYLPAFILGVLYYVMMNIKDNKEGAETYASWCPKPESGTVRTYTANLGENSIKQIVLIDSPEKEERSEQYDSTNEQRERVDIYDTTLEREVYMEEVPSKIPFIKKKIQHVRYVEKRKNVPDKNEK